MFAPQRRPDLEEVETFYFGPCNPVNSFMVMVMVMVRFMVFVWSCVGPWLGCLRLWVSQSTSALLSERTSFQYRCLKYCLERC